MNPEAMAKLCTDAYEAGHNVTFTHPKGVKLPHGFPRGELLSEGRMGRNVSYKPGHILNWLRLNALIPALEAA